MQNEQTLELLSFTPAGESWQLIGRYQTFIARVCECGNSAFISLHCISPEIDNRASSDNKGKPFRRFIKQCVSSGSVDKAVKKYDLPETELRFVIGGCYANLNNNL